MKKDRHPYAALTQAPPRKMAEADLWVPGDGQLRQDGGSREELESTPVACPKLAWMEELC